MPLQEHPVFVSPKDEQPLWRYMSFPKFVSLLTTSSLWFSNAEILAQDDPYEGVLPYGNYSHRQWECLQDIPLEILERFKNTLYTRAKSPHDEPIELKIEGEKSLRELRIRQAFLYRKKHYVNCWHASSFESAAMWKVYGYDDHGVAIISRLRRIKDAFDDFKDTIYCGQVKYIDYECEELDLSNAFYPIVHKRLSFEFEKEVRLVFCDGNVSHRHVKTRHPDGSIATCSFPKSEEEVLNFKASPGKMIQCDINSLIQEVKISPTAPDWFECAVRDLCKGLGFEKSVTKSNLNTGPIR